MQKGDAGFANHLVFALALAALAAGVLAHLLGQPDAASWLWTAGTLPAVAALALAILRGFASGRFGLDTIALLSMSVALLLREALAANVVALMYAGGTALETYAVARAQRDLSGLIDRAPRIAHRLLDDHRRRQSRRPARRSRG